jgi:hypothetical protein
MEGQVPGNESVGWKKPWKKVKPVTVNVTGILG